DQRLESRRNGRAELGAQRLGAGNDFLRVGNIGWSDLVHHLSRRVAKHALGPHVEDLNNAFFIGGDAGEVGTVEDRTLQSPGLEQRLFRALARGVVGAYEKITDDGVLIVAQGGDRDDRGKATSVFADVSQLIDVF